MFIQQIYKGCIAQEGYYKESDGESVDVMQNIDADDLFFLMDSKECLKVDVRKNAEAKSENIKRASVIPLKIIMNQMAEIDKEKKYVLFCTGSYRSTIAASMLKANEINNIINVSGGIEKIMKYNPELISV